MLVDLLWLYIAVPTVVVSVLVLIKLRQRKAGQGVAKRKPNVRGAEKMQVPLEAAGHSDLASKAEERMPESPNEPKPENCTHYLGYLYLKKAPTQTPIPAECYNCVKLLKCLYSPNVIETVYGK